MVYRAVDPSIQLLRPPPSGLPHRQRTNDAGGHGMDPCTTLRRPALHHQDNDRRDPLTARRHGGGQTCPALADHGGRLTHDRIWGLDGSLNPTRARMSDGEMVALNESVGRTEMED